MKYANTSGINLSLETSLSPNEFKKLIFAFKPLDIKVNFDMGNSASLGYNPNEEIDLLGDFIVNVHIKDRVRNGGTVPLGSGDTDFVTVFNKLKNVNYSGDFILQAARQDLHENKEKKDINVTIKNYINFIKPFLEKSWVILQNS